MNNINEQIIIEFYTSFQDKNYAGMQKCYHQDATFSDPVFQNLSSSEVKAMWEMLLRGAQDLEITFQDVKADAKTGHCHWEAKYTFSVTGRKVHNIITASFEFRDSKIFRHVDDFNFWRWSIMALGPKGLLLGWTPFVRQKVRGSARKRLDSFLKSQREHSPPGK
jgi:hypothetical protein